MNSTGPDINLEVSVAKALADRAGLGLQADCQALTPLPEGGIVSTKGHNLNCHFIFHINTTFYKDDNDCKVSILLFCNLKCCTHCLG